MLHEVLSGRRLTQLEYEHALPKLQDRLLDAQFELRKSRPRAVAVIVTGIPGAGRSEVVNELLGWLDPKFVTVYGFRTSNDVERQRPPLWRYWRVMPPKGRMAILHSGWYQDFLHASVRDPGRPRAMVRREVERIRNLEGMLVADGVAVVKIHLHIGPELQEKRLRKLLADKSTRWRVTPEDLWELRRYRRVERAMEHCLKATDSRAAPWHLVDGTDHQHRALEVGKVLLAGIEGRVGRGSSARQAGPAPRLRRRAVRAGSLTTHRGPRVAEEEYDRELEELQGRLALLSRRGKFAKHAVVVAFEGMDAAGKGGAIRRITAALDARQYRVVPISAPTAEEIARPYLWRFWFQLPPRGNYTIFDRSWYGRVLVERVRGLAAQRDWQRAYAEINEFERQLAEHRIIVAKYWLSVSPGEQLARFKERDRNPLKRFKVDREDWLNREHWAAYEKAARHMLTLTHTAQAPWYVVPADDKRYARLLVLRRLCERIESVLA
ncbi:MAG: polyphosphate:AMP phosphotransferase [Gammaproteobacteria bacterium]|nr:polyphosphate:AMP phosphotransferase [Gammaproteobacteria bacterium]